jgi:hypothetical protein
VWAELVGVIQFLATSLTIHAKSHPDGWRENYAPKLAKYKRAPTKAQGTSLFLSF